MEKHSRLNNNIDGNLVKEIKDKIINEGELVGNLTVQMLGDNCSLHHKLPDGIIYPGSIERFAFDNCSFRHRLPDGIIYPSSFEKLTFDNE